MRGLKNKATLFKVVKVDEKYIFKQDIMVAIHGTFILGIKHLSPQWTYPLTTPESHI